jgi:predicted Zn-dependent protease
MPFAVACSALLAVSCATFGSDKDIAAEHYAIAEGYAGNAKYDKAIEYYQKAARYKKFENAANYGLTRVYALSGKWEESCALLEALHAQDPDNTMITSSYAFVLASEGRSVKAMDLYERVYHASEDDPQAGRNYAEILVIVQRYQDALDVIAELKEKFPDADAMKGIDDLEKKATAGLNPAKAVSADGSEADGSNTESQAAEKGPPGDGSSPDSEVSPSPKP